VSTPSRRCFHYSTLFGASTEEFSASREVSKSAVGKATNGERFFLEGSAPALPKNSFLGTSGDVPSSFVNLWMVKFLLNRNQHDISRELRVFVEVSCLGFNAKILADKVKKLRVVWHK
jgi:hypothetical protein